MQTCKQSVAFQGRRIQTSLSPRRILKPTVRKSACVRAGFQPTPQWKSVDGTALTKEESKSLTEFLASKDEGLASGTESAKLLEQGSARGVERLTTLEGAMLLFEQVRVGGLQVDDVPRASQADPQQVDVWQPVFASSGGVPRLLYIPVPEYFDLTSKEPESSIDIITLLGPVTTHFLGTYKWMGKDELQYAISELKFGIGKAMFSFKLPGPLQLKNTLTFFYSSETCACARSKLGGTMLLVPRPDQAGKYAQA